MIAKAELPKFPKPQKETCKWHMGKRLVYFTGTVYVDGSGDDEQMVREATRCGWAVVQINGTELVGAYYGNLKVKNRRCLEPNLMQ